MWKGPYSHPRVKLKIVSFSVCTVELSPPLILFTISYVLDLKPRMSSGVLTLSLFVWIIGDFSLSVYCHFAVVERSFLCLKQFSSTVMIIRVLII